MWGLALFIESLGYVFSTKRWQPPEGQRGEATIAATPSLIERMGLFVIIVLGEVIVDAIDGMADIHPLEADGVIIGLLGVLVAIGLWWIYFDLVSHNTPVSRLTEIWLYLHFPLLVAVAAGGAGVLNTVEHFAEPLPDSVRWLLVGSLALAVVSVTALTLTLEVRSRHPEVYRMSGWTLLVSAALMMVVGTTDWGAKSTLEALVVLLLAPVIVGTVVWLRYSDPEPVVSVN